MSSKQEENKHKRDMRIRRQAFELFEELGDIEQPLSCYKHKEKAHKKFLKELRWYLGGLYFVLEGLEDKKHEQ